LISITEAGGGVAFSVKVHPRDRRNEITGELDGALKVSLTAPPIDGKANEACIEFFAKLLKVPRSSVYHCLRPEQPPESDPSVRALG
jgi:uncharacterized protein (TIGR00251 family)